MNRIITLGLITLALAGCGAQGSVRYSATMNDADAIRREQLAEQSLNVMSRRLENMGEVISSHTIDVTESGAIIALRAEHQEALDALTGQLQQPFSLAIMRQANEGEEAELKVDGQGGFVSTGITGEDLEWVTGRIQADVNMGEVILTFTEEGRKKMKDLFGKNIGKNIGIFVREQLVSKMQITSAEIRDEIVISNVPTPELATVFAEDVNVGLYVTFTPLP